MGDLAALACSLLAFGASSRAVAQPQARRSPPPNTSPQPAPAAAHPPPPQAARVKNGLGFADLIEGKGTAWIPRSSSKEIRDRSFSELARFPTPSRAGEILTTRPPHPAIALSALRKSALRRRADEREARSHVPGSL